MRLKVSLTLTCVLKWLDVDDHKSIIQQHKTVGEFVPTSLRLWFRCITNLRLQNGVAAVIIVVARAHIEREREREKACVLCDPVYSSTKTVNTSTDQCITAEDHCKIVVN